MGSRTSLRQIAQVILQAHDKDTEAADHLERMLSSSVYHASKRVRQLQSD
jgi:hypothetical protein